MSIKTKQLLSYMRPLILIGAVFLLKPYMLPYVISATTPQNMYSGGVYTDYDISALPSTWTIVLFFHADWCPSCVRAEKNFQASGIAKWVILIKVDYDSHKDLREKYGIRAQTSYAHIRPDGSLITSRVGSLSMEDILKHIQ